MTTTTVKTIGATGDYTTLQAWEDAAPANLVTSDIVWQGQCQNQTFTAGVVLSGSTSDATRYKHLTTVAGASFRDNANVQTNALRYNTANGASVALSGGGYTYYMQVTEPYAKVTNLQVSATGNTGTFAISGTGALVEFCIAEGTMSGGVAGASAGTICNSLIVMRGSARSAIFSMTGGAAYNCTFVCPSDLTKTTSAFGGYGYATNTIKNCAIFGCTALRSGSHPTFNVTTSYGDVTFTGVTTVTYDTTTGSGFQNTTNASSDFRIKSTSALVNTGTTDTTNAPVDIAGTARPSGAAYDVGAWEYVAAGGVTGDGSISSTAVISALGASLASGNAAASATATANGTGASVASAAGSIAATASVSGAASAGPSIVSADGSITAAASIAAIGVSSASAAASVVSVATVTGVPGTGGNTVSAAGSITASANATGVSASVASGNGQIVATANAQVVGASQAIAAGQIIALGAVNGSSVASVAKKVPGGPRPRIKQRTNDDELMEIALLLIPLISNGVLTCRH